MPAYARRLSSEGLLDARHASSGSTRGSRSWSRARSIAPWRRAPPDPEVAFRPVFAEPEARLYPRALPTSGLAGTSAEAATTGRGLTDRWEVFDPAHGEADDDARRSRPRPRDLPADADAPTAMAAFTGGAVGPTSGRARSTYLDAIHQALREEMERDPSVVLLGQDIAAFEGAFRVTRGLHARWPERVLDTPIAESGTLGIAAGAALLGYRPVVEMQFADFVSCGFNQIVNVLAKLYYRFERPCPVVVRLPAGGGVGAGPFHSQNPEAWFAHVAGLKVVCPATARDAKGAAQGGASATPTR